MTLILVISFDMYLSLYTIMIKDAESGVTLPGLQSRFCQLVAGWLSKLFEHLRALFHHLLSGNNDNRTYLWGVWRIR